ncbi:MAG: HAMP domain-containing histidine kinase, partial [Pseudomonadota bacterium]|nr:HAMP domain-containing histidine kinase [Pseudomonadota bacterium]
AWVVYWLSVGQVVVPSGYDPIVWPLFGFAVSTGGILNYRHQLGLRAQERLDTMVAVGSNIAHELRTPLLGIKSGAAGLKRYLPDLLESHRLARAHGLAVPEIRDVHARALAAVLERIEMETDYSNAIIDMLLMNAGRKSVDPADFSLHSMSACIHRMLARYPFKTPWERQRIQWRDDQDFLFWGSDILMIHVLFNLLKNAQYFVARAGKGSIRIHLECGKDFNYLYFKDTGTGIPQAVLPHIFKRFYTTREEGSGIGLSFCAMVMQQFGGMIDCRSEPGEYTEFVLAFPSSRQGAGSR